MLTAGWGHGRELEKVSKSSAVSALKTITRDDVAEKSRVMEQEGCL